MHPPYNVFIGIAVVNGLATWMLSPIKLQADMGLLPTVILNILSALALIPAIAWLLNIGVHWSKRQ
jgi:predicted RND superfamily exporter protein